jgi:hypothetical protein
MVHIEAMFVFASQLIFSVAKLRSQKQKQIIKFSTDF